MADGTTINAGSGGDVIATDDIASGVAAGQKVQRAKSGWGADGSYVDTDTTNPLPVRATGAQASGSALTGNPVLVGGSDNTNVRNIRTDTGGAVLTRIVNSSLSTIEVIDNAAFTDGTTSLLMSGYVFDEVAGTALTENDGAAARIDSKRAQVIAIEDATTRGQRLAVSSAGAAMVAGAAASGSAVTGNPVLVGGSDGTNARTLKTLTDGTLVVSGSSAGTQYLEDAAHASGDTGNMMLGVRQDTQAAQTNANGDYGAIALDKFGSVRVTALAAVTGSITANGQSITADVSGMSAVGIDFSGTFTGTLQFEASVDGTTFVACPAVTITGSAVLSASAATTGVRRVNVAGMKQFRVRSSAWTSGTLNVALQPAIEYPGLMGWQNNVGWTPITVTSGGLLQLAPQVIDNAAFTDGTSPLIPAGFIFDEVAGTALTENDGAAARVDSKRAQVMVVEDATTRGQRQAVDTNGAAKVAGIGVVTITASYTRPADTTAYAASDAMSNSTSSPSVLTFTSLASASGKSGIITDLFVSSTAAAAMSGELWLFDTSPTAINDNAAFALSDADAQKAIAKIPFTTSVDATNNAVAHISNLGIGFTGSGSANIFGLVRVTQAYTPANAEVVQFRLKALQVN